MSWRKWMKIGGITFGGLLAIALMINAIMIQITGAQLAKRIEALRKANEPVTLQDLQGERVSPELNVATYLRRVQADSEALDKELYPMLKDSRGRLTAEEVQKVAEAFEAYPVVPLLRKAAELEKYSPDLDYTLPATQFIEKMLTHVQSKRSAFRVLHTRVRQLVAQEQIEEAAETCLLMFRLSELTERDPTLIAFLVTNACLGVSIAATNEVLQSGDISDNMRERLDEALDRLDSRENYAWALRSERVFGLAMYRDVVPLGNSWFTRAFYNLQVLAYLDLIDQEIAYADRDISEPGPDLMAAARGKVLLELLVPALDAAREAHRRVVAQGRSLRVLNAIQGKELDPQQKQIDLVDLDLPARSTVDPYTGKPLLTKWTSDGWIVYSVGKNLQDDGGSLAKIEDVGVGPPVEETSGTEKPVQ